MCSWTEACSIGKIPVLTQLKGFIHFPWEPKSGLGRHTKYLKMNVENNGSKMAKTI